MLKFLFLMLPIQTNREFLGRIIKGGVITIFGHFGSQGLRLISNLIMARLLIPEVFGIMAVAYVLLMAMALFSDVGLQQNIVQSRRGNDPVFLNTAWSIKILRGLFIWFLSILAAALVYIFSKYSVFSVNSAYADPILPYVIVLLSFTAVIDGFGSTKIATANRRLAFGKITAIDLLAQVVGLAAMLTWVWVDRSVWALVAGSIAASLSRSVMSHFLLPGPKNYFFWDTETFWEIFHFGKWIFISSILGFIASNGDRLLLGGMINARSFGIYSISLLMLGAIEGVILALITKVAFPTLSEVIRENSSRLKQAYYYFRLPIDATLFFLAGFLFLAGSDIVEFLYDDRYIEAGYILEILSLRLTMLQYTLVGQCFMAMGKPKMMIPIIALRATIILFLLPIIYFQFGFNAVLWLIALGNFITLPIYIFLMKKINIFSFWKELRAIPFFIVGIFFGRLLNLLLLSG